MSKYYTDITANNDGSPFPDTQPINASGPVATDGTEFVKEVLSDVWNEKQAELDFYNYPPNGAEDLAGVDVSGYPNSQPLLAKYMNYGTPGKVVNLGWNDALDPAIISAGIGCDVRILLLNGQGIDRTLPEYNLLDTLCYVGDIANPTADYFYHATDPAGVFPNPTGDYLILPDMRGQFVRGLDEGKGIDPDGATRITGSAQDDAFQNITGNFHLRSVDGANGYLTVQANDAFKDGNIVGTTPLNQGLASLGGVDNPPWITNFDASGSPGARTSIETRSTNIAYRFGIYY